MTEKQAAGQLALHPATLVIGVGCERDVDEGELAELVKGALADAGLAAGSVACLASLDLKEDERAVRALADDMDLPLRLFTASRLEEETPRLSDPSETVFAAIGCHGVAEGAALAAAGADGQLIVTKTKSKRATCAIAQAPAIIDPGSVGRSPGHLSIIGIGPGRADWRAPEATSLVARATDIVGYSLYLDLLDSLMDGKARHDYDLGAESERVAFALKLAAEGKNVALVCSGDAGIYAMAALVYELVDTAEEDAWRRLDIQVVPGISALQAGAARAGAPLGHDFCTISLSDLLTPWEVIQKRLHGAAQGDFVVALYNPASRRRRHQLV
ncbi:MAG: cobalamin biosynthesis protein, partial [Rhodospirillales bacterium]|nr:cobalamin biosynthesis protein [Rhodospirillales bacterium]